MGSEGAQPEERKYSGNKEALGGRMNLKHSAEKQRTGAQVVAVSNFAVISAECHVGLADTEKATGWEHKKKIRPGMLHDAIGN